MRIFSVFVFLLSAGFPVFADDRVASDFISQSVLNDCDAQARPSDLYEQRVRDAVDGLIDIGAFAQDDFHDVKIGFCKLRQENGPVATTNCVNDTILMDVKYNRDGQQFAMKATLAHEMKHYFQHREQKSRLGAAYCDSQQYESDKPWMEAAADQFGDQIGELLFLRRPIEIENSCASPVPVYLDEYSVTYNETGPHDFISVPPNSVILAPATSGSKDIKFYAETEINGDQFRLWHDPLLADKRIIDGKRIGLKNYTLSNASRTTGPFKLSLSCP